MYLTLIAYLGLVFLLSVVTFAIYGVDKRRATHGGWRIPEQTLHLLAFAGGWPGAFLAQGFFRHKTRKPAFLFTFWAMVILHLILAAGVFIKVATGQ